MASTRDELTGEPPPAGEDEECRDLRGLEYPFSGQPKILTLQPPTAGGDFRQRRSASSPTTSACGDGFRYLGAVASLGLDWDDRGTPSSETAICGGSSLPHERLPDVEHYEVRVEIITRPKTSNSGSTWVWKAVARSVDIEEEIKARVPAFLADHLNLLVDVLQSLPNSTGSIS